MEGDLLRVTKTSEAFDYLIEYTPDFERDFLLEYLFEAPLYSNPDYGYHYSNTNYYLLGLIIEQLSGMTYQEYMPFFRLFTIFRLIFQIISLLLKKARINL